MIRLRDLITGHRHRLVLLSLIAALAVAVASEHAGIGHEEMADEPIADATAMCLAVLAGAALPLAGAALLEAGRRVALVPVAELTPVAESWNVPVAATMPARAGPSLLQVFRR